ncbi:MAG: GNAT family N-acetyltransferase [Gammaproteobacteria bacterium]|nr:GNAT family N-acetyltransferase [Gammaproteobacteria bacterium]
MTRIDVLGPRDARALNRLTQRALREHPTAFTTDVAAVARRRDDEVAAHLRELRRGRGFRLGAFDDAGNLVGTVRLNPRSGSRLAHSADLIFLYVCAEAQNRGIGRALIQRAIELAREIDGLRQLELSVSSDSPAARHLYESLGFRATGVLKRQIRVDDDYHDLVPMWRSLED